MTIWTRARTAFAVAALTLTTATGAFAAKVELLETAPEGAVVVNIDKMAYETPEITIKAGESVTWTNLEVMPHNVEFAAGVAGDEKVRGDMLKKGETWTMQFNEPGTYDYHCTPHPFMRGTVVVE